MLSEYEAMPEEHFWSSCLKEVVEDKKRRMEVDRETEEEVSKKMTREGERGEDETMAGLMLLTFLVKERIRRVVVMLGVICGMILVACLIVTL